MMKMSFISLFIIQYIVKKLIKVCNFWVTQQLNVGLTMDWLNDDVSQDQIHTEICRINIF
jgi:hypothetical protein